MIHSWNDDTFMKRWYIHETMIPSWNSDIFRPWEGIQDVIKQIYAWYWYITGVVVCCDGAMELLEEIWLNLAHLCLILVTRIEVFQIRFLMVVCIHHRQEYKKIVTLRIQFGCPTVSKKTNPSFGFLSSHRRSCSCFPLIVALVLPALSTSLFFFSPKRSAWLHPAIEILMPGICTFRSIGLPCFCFFVSSIAIVAFADTFCILESLHQGVEMMQDIDQLRFPLILDWRMYGACCISDVRPMKRLSFHQLRFLTDDDKGLSLAEHWDWHTDGAFISLLHEWKGVVLTQMSDWWNREAVTSLAFFPRDR